MSDPYHSEVLERLREQVAELTRRVYRLEELLGARTQDAVSSAQPATESEAEPKTKASASVPVVAPPVISTKEPSASPSIMASPTAHRPDREAVEASLESRIGGQWLNRVGIVAVLVGLSYFLKLAFDNDWIGPSTQVAIGIIAGIGLLFWSQRFRRKGYPGFAFSLNAIGIGALYLSLWAAPQFYHLHLPSHRFLRNGDGHTDFSYPLPAAERGTAGRPDPHRRLSNAGAGFHQSEP